jgi:hypothetical protein
MTYKPSKTGTTCGAYNKEAYLTAYMGQCTYSHVYSSCSEIMEFQGLRKVKRKLQAAVKHSDTMGVVASHLYSNQLSSDQEEKEKILPKDIFPTL